MNVTDIRIRKINKSGKTKALVSVTFDDEFVVHEIKIIEGENGMFIAMPSRKRVDGGFRDVAHPISQNTRERIQTLVLEKYANSDFIEQSAVSAE